MPVVLLGNSRSALAIDLLAIAGVRSIDVEIGKFADGELNVQVSDSARSTDVFVVQSLSAPVNDRLLELIMIVDAAYRAGAQRVAAVIPYLGYARQDRVIRNETMVSALSAKVVADLLSAVRVNRLISVDLHCQQLQGFFPTGITNIDPIKSFVSLATRIGKTDELVIVAPDIGATTRSRMFAKALSKQTKTEVQTVIIEKFRQKAGVSEVMNVIGEVNGKVCIIVDDIVDSAGTLCNAAAALKEQGALAVYGFITHGVLSGSACERISRSMLDKLFITNSIDHERLPNKIETVSIANLLFENMVF